MSDGNHFTKGIFYAVVLIGVTTGTMFGISTMSRMTRPPVTSVQRGYRGTGLEQLYNPAALADRLADKSNKWPGVLPEPGPNGPKAGQVYKNVKVLGGLSVGQFTRLMVTVAGWVAPKQGCAYCHNVANMADDTNYTKRVARRMFQMVQAINSTWSTHVHQTGVTCFTCHRGNPVPQYVWFHNPGPQAAGGYAETQTGMTHPNAVAGGSGLPYDPFTPFLEGTQNIRVQGTDPLPGGNLSSIKQTEWTYSLMMNMSQSLGVNCDYCHNTRDLGVWSDSSPARVTAWYGIRMVRDINNTYLDSLQDVFPSYRLGPTGDNAKVYCMTCHQGVYKPLFGVSVLKKFPELARPIPPEGTGPT
jgi:photosynthetic reaction center cytochrome c subunit